MKTEKRADGTEVVTFETRPWKKQNPCVGCKTGKVDPLKEVVNTLDHLLAELESLLMMCWDAEDGEEIYRKKDCSECDECQEYAKWNEEQEYWEKRRIAVQNGKWRAEDDEGSEKRVDGEADEERDKETDAED